MLPLLPGSLHQKGSLESVVSTLETVEQSVWEVSRVLWDRGLLFTSHPWLVLSVCLCIVCTMGELIHGNEPFTEQPLLGGDTF